MKEFLERISGNKFTAEQITKMGETTQKQFGLSNEAVDQLMFAMLVLGQSGQKHILNKTKKIF